MNVEAGQPGSGTIEVIARPARTEALYFVLPLIVLPRVYIDGNLVGWAIWLRPLVRAVPIGTHDVTVSCAGYVRSLEVRVHRETVTRLSYRPPATGLGTEKLVLVDTARGDPAAG